MRLLIAIAAGGLALAACHAILDLDAYGPAPSDSTVATGGGAGGAGGRGGGAGVPWLDAHPRRKLVELDTTIVTSDIQGFTTPIVIADDADLAAAAQPDGRDIAFAAADGVTQLSHELEFYNSQAGALVAWVRLGEIRASSSTQIYIYFGSDAGAQQDPEGTWPTNLYRGVWHLAGDPQGAPPQIRDSTSYGSDGTVGGAPVSAAGVAGPALQFAGGADRVTIADADQLDFDSTSFSFSCWVNAPDSNTSGDRPFDKIVAQPLRGYIVRLGDGPWQAEIADGTTTLSVGFGNEMDHVDSWTQLAVVVDSASGFVVAYADGVVSSSRMIGALVVPSMPTSVPLYFSPGGGPFVGAIDEVRLYGAALSDDWVALEHHALTSPDYISVGQLEGL